MPAFKKAVAYSGSYRTPEGPAEVTPARISHWADTVNAMVAEGIRPPVSWGHNSAALPHTDDDAAFWAARFNAGRLTGAEVEGDVLYLLGDAPGLEQRDGDLVTQVELPSGLKATTSIGEVSIGVRDWTDGTGRTWPDAPVHLALTPLPVIVPPGGQPGFEAAPAGTLSFGTANLLGGAEHFAAPPFKKAAPAEKAKPPVESDPEPTDAADLPDGEGDDAAKVAAILDLLARCGITLPGDTSTENFLDRLYTAATSVAGSENVNDPGNVAGATEDTGGGTYMSTVTAVRDDPYVKTLEARAAALEARAVANDRARASETLDRLVKKCGLKPTVASRLRSELSAVRFATAPDGSEVKAEVYRQIELLAETLPEGETDNLYFATVTEAKPPEGEEADEDARHRRVADEFAKNVRLPARASA